MVIVSQNQMTRRWGYRVIEGVAEPDGTQRILYEDFSFEAPQVVFGILPRIKEALDSNFIKYTHDDIIYGYQVYDVKTKELLMEESGWTQPDHVQNHVNNLKAFMTSDFKMASAPAPRIMAINGGSGNTGMKSSYTDPITGITKEYGGSSDSLPNLEAIRRESELDNEAEKMDNVKLLGG